MARQRLVAEVQRVAGEMARQGGGGAWSTAERIAGALLNGRIDWLPERYDHPVDAIIRLGPEWMDAVCEAREAAINYR